MGNKIILFALFLLIAPIFAQANNNIDIQYDHTLAPSSVAPITSVVLYSNTAEITRIAKVNSGDTQLIIPNIPLSFNQNTLSIKAEDGIEIGDTTINIKQKFTPFIAEERRLVNEINKIKNIIAGFDIEISSANLQLDYLHSLNNYSSEKDYLIDTDKILPLLYAMEQGSKNAQTKIHQAKENKKRYNQQLTALNQDLERIKSHINQVANLNIRLLAANQGQVKITYNIYEAGWSSAYRANLNTQNNSLELERIAKISQKSGEDWQNVKLKILTGTPTNRTYGYTPDTWAVDFIKHQEELSENFSGGPELKNRSVETRRSGLLNASVLASSSRFNVAINNADYSTEYELSEPYDLLADGRNITISLNKITLPIKIYGQTAPRIEQSVYLIAESKIPEGVWPNGEIQLYLDGAFIGKSQLNLTKAKELELSFGLDKLIKVEHKRKDIVSEGSGLFITTKQKKFWDVFAITNLHKKAINVEVLDASPVARHKDITITRIFEPKVTQDNWKSRQGVVSWLATIKPNKTQEFSAEYIIKWPKNKNVSTIY